MSVQSLQKAASIFSQILVSDKISELWDQDYSGEKDKNPSKQIGKILEYLPEALEKNHNLRSFVYELSQIEKKARAFNGADAPELNQALPDFLQAIQGDAPWPKRDNLPEEYQRILKLVELDLGQNKTNPHKWVIKATRDLAQEIKNDVKANPYTTSGFGVVTAAFVYYMWSIGSLGGTFLLGKEATMVEAYGYGDMLLQIEDPSYVPPLNEALYNPNLLPGCHQHLEAIFKPIVGKETAADMSVAIAEAPVIRNVFPQDCPATKDVADSVKGVFDAVNSRITAIIETPFAHLGMQLQESPFRDAFLDAVRNGSAFWQSANWVEFFAFHIILFGLAHKKGLQYGSLQNEETSELKINGKNFFGRTLRNNYLNYIFAASAAGISVGAKILSKPEIGNVAMQSDIPLASVVVWSAIGAAFLGHFAHKSIRSLNATNRAAQHVISINKTELTSTDIEQIITDAKAGEKIRKKNNSWENVVFGKTNTGKLARLTPLFVAADFALSGGVCTGYALGTAIVSAVFFAYNVPEDLGIHATILTIGGTTGVIRAKVGNAVNRMKPPSL